MRQVQTATRQKVKYGLPTHPQKTDKHNPKTQDYTNATDYAIYNIPNPRG